MTPGSQHANVLRTLVSTCQDHGVSEIYTRHFLQIPCPLLTKQALAKSLPLANPIGSSTLARLSATMVLRASLIFLPCIQVLHLGNVDYCFYAKTARKYLLLVSINRWGKERSRRSHKAFLRDLAPKWDSESRRYHDVRLPTQKAETRPGGNEVSTETAYWRTPIKSMRLGAWTEIPPNKNSCKTMLPPGLFPLLHEL